MIGGRQARDRSDPLEAFEDRLERLPWWLKTQVFVARAAAWAMHRTAYGASSLVFTWPGRAVGGSLAGLALLDASWGADAVEVPLVGGFWLAAGLGALGVWDYERRRRREDLICETVREVFQHSSARPERLWFGPHLGPLHLNTWTRRWDFRFKLRGKWTRKDLPERLAHLRQRLPADEGKSWAARFDLKQSMVHVWVVDDLRSDGDEPLRREQTAPDASAVRSAAEAERAATLIPVGKSLEGPIVWDCSNLYGCILIAGAPGGGKSVAARNIVAHCFAHPDHWRVRFVDMKRVEFAGMRKHMPVPVEDVALDLDEAARSLQSCHEETMRRMALLENADVQNIHELNDIRRSRGQAGLEHLMVVVDEVAELTEEDGSRGAREEDQKRATCKRLLNSVVRLGRAAGVHMVLATQRPDAEFVPGSTKSNIQARLAMGNLSRTGSEMTLEDPMAADLPGVPGRGIWFESGDLTECDVYFTSRKDLDRLALEARSRRSA